MCFCVASVDCFFVATKIHGTLIKRIQMKKSKNCVLKVWLFLCCNSPLILPVRCICSGGICCSCVARTAEILSCWGYSCCKRWIRNPVFFNTEFCHFFLTKFCEILNFLFLVFSRLFFLIFFQNLPDFRYHKIQ